MGNGECAGSGNIKSNINKKWDNFKSLRAYAKKVMVPFSEQSGVISSVMDGGANVNLIVRADAELILKTI